MKILKKGGVVEKRGEEETKYMPHAPVRSMKLWHHTYFHICIKKKGVVVEKRGGGGNEIHAPCACDRSNRYLVQVNYISLQKCYR
jgi:hypothetical protein